MLKNEAGANLAEEVLTVMDTLKREPSDMGKSDIEMIESGLAFAENRGEINGYIVKTSIVLLELAEGSEFVEERIRRKLLKRARLLLAQTVSIPGYNEDESK